ncbi:hypothetical protein [Hyphococcus sp.]|uniref:hypothetical protein n=1 Tax=Hyphococcus sp. TaxID=2038636 RepID=UPI003CCBAC04
MLRKTILSASTIALMTTAACAQENAQQAESQSAPAETVTQNAETSQPMDDAAHTTASTNIKILDASQVNTKNEAKLYAESEFRQADINQDGSIDRNEFLAYAVIRAPLEDPKLKGTDQPVTAPEEPVVEENDVAAADEPANAEEQFAQISNGDDTISEAEMIDSRVAQFDAADADDDEQLNTDERKKFMKLAELKPSSSTSL